MEVNTRPTQGPKGRPMDSEGMSSDIVPILFCLLYFGDFLQMTDNQIVEYLQLSPVLLH